MRVTTKSPLETQKQDDKARTDRDAAARQRIEELAKDFAAKAAKQRAPVGTGIRFPENAPSLDGLRLPDGVVVELNQDGTVDIQASPGEHPNAGKVDY